MDRRIIPLIMCGGAGTRLWPASREVHPKQFLPLFGPRSTFQDTMLRVSDAALFERPIVITNIAYRFMVLEQLAEIGLEADILLEPMRRDSGPAIAAGAAFAQSRDSEAIVLALAADHVVRDTAAFVAACRQGLAAAEAGRIVTFGVAPERAATEYGYISPGDVDFRRGPQRRQIRREAGSEDGGRIRQGRAISGTAAISCSAPSVLLDEYRNVDADSVQAVTDAVTKAGRDLGFVKLDPDAFGSAKAISIDYAVMEKTARAAVVPVACGWSDVGSWHAVWELSDKDAQGNAAQGAAVFEDSAQLQRLDRPGAGGAGRRRRSRGGGDAGRRAGVAPEGRQRPEAAGGEAEGRRARGDRGSHQGAPALGHPTNRSTMAIVTRSSASSSSRAAGCRCRSITIAPNTGSWCAARRG